MVDQVVQQYDRFVQHCTDSANAMLAQKPWYANSTDVVAKARIYAAVFALGCDTALGLITDAQYQQRLAAISAQAEAMKRRGN
jgi:hypothetical protein